jgi:kynurenine 3-monooxygenase
VRYPNNNAISELSKNNFFVLRDKMADPEYILRKHIITYLTDHYSDLYTSQHSMIDFSYLDYSKALSFTEVED